MGLKYGRVASQCGFVSTFLQRKIKDLLKSSVAVMLRASLGSSNFFFSFSAFPLLHLGFNETVTKCLPHSDRHLVAWLLDNEDCEK